MNIYEKLEKIQSWKEEYTDTLGKPYSPKQFEYLIKKSDVIKLLRQFHKEVIEQLPLIHLVREDEQLVVVKLEDVKKLLDGE